jgi:CRISPR/Cas system-associated endonuclease Cas1
MDEKCCLKYSKIFIKSKIHNSKVMLRRWTKWSGKVVDVEDTIKSLDYYLQEIENTDSLESVRGYE